MALVSGPGSYGMLTRSGCRGANIRSSSTVMETSGSRLERGEPQILEKQVAVSGALHRMPVRSSLNVASVAKLGGGPSLGL